MRGYQTVMTARKKMKQGNVLCWDGRVWVLMQICLLETVFWKK